MKKFFIWLLPAALIFAGCKKLDQVPQDTATKDAVFSTEKGLELYANSFYKLLPTPSEAHKGDAMADYAARSQAPDFLIKGAFGPRQSNGWNWDELRNINYFI